MPVKDVLDEAILAIGATVRAARLARRLSQQQAAKEARVSRAHLAALERGSNVSLRFLLKIGSYLGLEIGVITGLYADAPGTRSQTSASDLIQAFDLLTSLVEHVRGIALETMMPPSERRSSTPDVSLLREFLAKHMGDEAGLVLLASAVSRLSEERPSNLAPPPQAPEPDSPEVRVNRKTPRRS